MLLHKLQSESVKSLEELEVTNLVSFEVTDHTGNLNDPIGQEEHMNKLMEFKDMTKRDSKIRMKKELEKMTGCIDSKTQKENVMKRLAKQLDGFQPLFNKFISSGSQERIVWDNIENLPSDAIRKYSSLAQPGDCNSIKQMLDKLVVVKLNGGLGTSMGCKGPKSVIAVRSDLTFLDLTVQQIEHLNIKYDSDVPLVLMNSFNTSEETAKIIKKYAGLRVKIHVFEQSRYPRINKETLLPVAKSLELQNDSELDYWYPPGHGDFYNSFSKSGLLDSFLDEGKDFVFLSNIDNLGATVDFNILSSLSDGFKTSDDDTTSPSKNGGIDFVMEVTERTRADVKGGTLIQYENKLRLLEVAQVPKDKEEEFKSVKKFPVFNTNNLWIKLSGIKSHIQQGDLHDLEIIVNPKTLDGGLNVIQLETAVGSAMKCFGRAVGINVPRSRFLPVKKCSDLLLIMSNLYSMHDGSLVMSPDRMFLTTPLIKLGDKHFKKVSDFLNRFASIPDILELDHLTVSGDVTFGRGVILKGTVIIIANQNERIDIPPGAVLENKIVSGNLVILDH